MASPLDSDDDNIFEKLKQNANPKAPEERERLVNERAYTQYARHSRRLAELVDTNTTLPVTVSSVNVLGAFRTRRSFLERIFNPLLSSNRDAPYNLAEALAEVSAKANTLHKFDIFHPPISIYIDRPDNTVSSSTPTDIAIYLSVREKSGLLFKTGTDLGNTEGSAYGNLLWRNIFGGAESLNLLASLGTRTRSAYSLSFETPVKSDPDVRWDIYGSASSTKKDWSSHEEVLKGFGTRYRWMTGTGTRHELAYSGSWRQITGLAEKASPTVRGDAGDTVKGSFSHTWIVDRRDNPLLPSRGHLLKSVSELAGWGPLGGDVAFWKSEMESQLAVPVPIPGVRENAVTFTTGLRAGLLYPLSRDGKSQPLQSRINDRFQLGGPTDVRGFRPSGLGPRDGPDAIGGDVYAAASANLFFPLPQVAPDRPIRLQAFINGGRLLALRDTRTTGNDDGEGAGGGGGGVQRSVYATMAQMFDGLPSTAAGIGIVYAHPVARFELNFSLPLVLRKGEEGRKGLQFGVGISFM
ncbi:MAG: hypothetical protein M1816_000635 [Peltula sp. TS41687]|nr:MAG: hypothetical protein M1816_000635 [Peltula sp. TS41687]